MTDTKFPALSPGDAAPSYDPAIYGKSLTYEEIAARLGALIFIDNNWWDELEDKDADAAVMRVVEKTNGYIVRDDGDGLIRLYRQQMLPDVHGGYFKVWAVKTEQEDVSPAPAPVPQEVTAPVPDEQTFSIESPYFAQLRADLGAMLQKVVTQLLSKDSDEASGSHIRPMCSNVPSSCRSSSTRSAPPSPSRTRSRDARTATASSSSMPRPNAISCVVCRMTNSSPSSERSTHDRSRARIDGRAPC